MQAADLLWPRDEKRARALFRAAAADFAATNPERRGNVVRGGPQLPRNFLYIVAARAARLARKLLRDSRPAAGGGSDAPAGDSDWEPKTEQELKRFAAAFDSKTALRLAEEGLKGFTFELLALLWRLCREDPKAATKLAGKIVERLRGETPDGGRKAWAPAMYLLSGALQSKPGEKPRYYNLPGSPSRDPVWPWRLVIVMEEADVRELADLVGAAVLKDSYANGAHGLMVMSIRELIPELEKLVPASATRLNLRLAEMDKPLDPRRRALAQYSTIMRRPPEVILENAAQASAETRRPCYQAAAAKLFAAGEVERARAVVTENLRGQEREEMLAHLDDAEIERAVEQGKPDAARAAVSRISNERRAAALAEVAAAYAGKGDKKTAGGLLEEARGLIARPPTNMREAEALLDIARGYAPVEPARTFELIDSLLDLPLQNGRMLARQLLKDRYVWGSLFSPQDEVTLALGAAARGAARSSRASSSCSPNSRAWTSTARAGWPTASTPTNSASWPASSSPAASSSNRPDPLARTSNSYIYYIP